MSRISHRTRVTDHPALAAAAMDGSLSALKEAVESLMFVRVRNSVAPGLNGQVRETI